jgi:hypothetical protein
MFAVGFEEITRFAWATPAPARKARNASLNALRNLVADRSNTPIPSRYARKKPINIAGTGQSNIQGNVTVAKMAGSSCR